MIPLETLNRWAPFTDDELAALGNAIAYIAVSIGQFPADDLLKTIDAEITRRQPSPAIIVEIEDIKDRGDGPE